ncbi:sulfite exporter TauE/SafE family protein, partial [Francisella tularensis subsp. holarctica]|nr:sulfite exporter TauE/SafE family protein [Francisella tularensis subsp. holarctica]
MSIFFISFGWHESILPPYSIGYLNLIFFLVGLIHSLIGVNIVVKATSSFPKKYLQIIYILM